MTTSKIKIILLLLMAVMKSNAQKGQIEYLYSKPENTKHVYKPILKFNDSLSVFIYNRTGYDSPTKEGMSQRDDGGILLTFTSGDALGGQVYTDFKNKKIIFRRPKSKIIEPYIVEDNWVVINWEIKKKTKKIEKYTVTKAIGEFRGREYTVWFTYEIPLPIGPWKLKGLPGAILEAKDKEGTFKVKFVSVKYPDGFVGDIAKPTAKNKLTLKEHVFAKDNFEAILLKKIQSRMPKSMKGRLSLIKKTKKQKRRQLKERTYEWETEVINERKN